MGGWRNWSLSNYVAADRSPIRVYLDQKDFSRIGKGLAGNPHCLVDVEIYDWLLPLVEAGRIRVYFSWCHAVETLRYDDSKVDVLEPYCRAIDNLTQGHCIRWPIAILQEEISACLAQLSGFGGQVVADYPYGRTVDAFPPIPYHAFGPMEEAVKKELENDLSIGPLVNLSLQAPQFKKLGTFFDSLAGSIVASLQAEQQKYGEDGMEPKVVERTLVDLFLKHIDARLEEFCAEHGIDRDVIREKLRKSKLAGIPALNVVVTFAVEYYKRHRGELGRSRKPKQSDFLDLHHIRNLPYVDVFGCDAFFAEVAKNTAKHFGAQVAPKLTDVQRILEKDYSLRS